MSNPDEVKLPEVKSEVPGGHGAGSVCANPNPLCPCGGGVGWGGSPRRSVQRSQPPSLRVFVRENGIHWKENTIFTLYLRNFA